MKMSSQEEKYYKLYKFYKNKCSLMAIKNQKLEAMIESCRNLLGGNVFLSPVMSSTPNTSFLHPRRNLSLSLNESCSNSCESLPDEPGANKWECVSDDERERLIKYEAAQSEIPSTNATKNGNITPPQEQSIHANSTFFESAHAANGNSTLPREQSNQCNKVECFEKSGTITPKRLIKNEADDETFYESPPGACNGNSTSTSSDFTLNETPKQTYLNETPKQTNLNEAPKQTTLNETPKKAQRKRVLPKTPEHVCTWPRCKDHQQFYVSSKRKLAQLNLSPRSYKMATTERQKSPKSKTFWNLDMPSTQWIRTRNQDKESPNKEN